MANIRVRTNIKFPKKVMNAKVAQQIDMAIQQGIRESLSLSQSPVKGYGKFVGYAAERFGDPTKYPGKLKRKRPVNLQLSGAMITAIKVLSFTDDKVTIGIASPKQKLKAETHNEGTQEPRVPQRRFLPTGPGEEFVDSIQKKILAIIEKRVSDLFKR